MSVRRSLRAVVLFLLLGWLTSATVAAWGTLAHYAIGREALGRDVALFHLLPDSWPRITGTVDISEWFAWSHGVLRTGRAGIVPRVPVYANENPGEAMYQRCRTTPTACGPLGPATALGFLAHGVVDREVHWAFFPGGTYKLWRQHEPKENWADCVIYERILGGKFSEDEGAATDLPYVDNNGDAGVIRFAQQDFIKNPNNRQYSVNRDPPRTTLPRDETEQEIQGRIGDFRARIASDLQGINRRNCKDLNDTAMDEKWSAADVEKHFRAAVDAVKRIYSAHPF